MVRAKWPRVVEVRKASARGRKRAAFRRGEEEGALVMGELGEPP